MILAAKAMVLTMMGLVTKPGIPKVACDELRAGTEGKRYKSPLADGSVPHRRDVGLQRCLLQTMELCLTNPGSSWYNRDAKE